jgi:hypothetical protein
VALYKKKQIMTVQHISKDTKSNQLRLLTLSFSVHPRYFKYKSCKKSDGYDKTHTPRDSMHDVRILGSISRYRCTNNLQKEKNKKSQKAISIKMSISSMKQEID